jgi:hypothetical protein
MDFVFVILALLALRNYLFLLFRYVILTGCPPAVCPIVPPRSATAPLVVRSTTTEGAPEPALIDLDGSRSNTRDTAPPHR